MHCHIARHAAEGLELQILERQTYALARWPNKERSHAVSEADRVCRNWKDWWKGLQNDSGV